MEVKLTDYQAEVLQGLLAEQIDANEQYAVLQPLYEQLTKEDNELRIKYLEGSASYFSSFTPEEMEELKLKYALLMGKKINKSPNTYEVLISYEVSVDLDYQPTEEQLTEEVVKVLLSTKQETVVEDGYFEGDFNKCKDWNN
jgi:hypothetical protein